MTLVEMCTDVSQKTGLDPAVIEEMADAAVVRCPHCQLNQFMTSKGLCRRCGKVLIPPPPPSPVEELHEVAVNPVSGETFSEAVKLVLCAHRGEMSQRNLAQKLGVPRSYISKVEIGHCTPPLKKLERFAAVFGVPLWRLVWEIECFAKVLAGIGGSETV